MGRTTRDPGRTGRQRRPAGIGLLLAINLVAAGCSTTPEESRGTTTTATPPDSTTVPPSTGATTTTTAAPATTAAPPTTRPERLRTAATASAALDGFAPGAADDGDPDTWWGAGDFPVHWIELTLEGTASIHRIELVVSQDPAGATTHLVWGRGEDGEEVLLTTLEGVTEDLDILTVVPEAPWDGIRRLRFETTDSPSWVGWREIAVFGEVTDDPGSVSASVVFIGGPIVTMDPAHPAPEAVAVGGGEIIAVGDAAEVMDLADDATVIVDLKGRALLPGFIDPHTHLLNDAWRIDTDLAGAQQIALESGFTTITNLFTPDWFLEEMEAFAASGALRIRTSLYLLGGDNCGVLQGDWWKAHPRTTDPARLLQIAGIKLFADGGSCDRPAVSEEIVEGDGLGELYFTIDELTAVIDEIDAAGRQAVIHAIGDRAIETAQHALAAVIGDDPNRLRHRIDHNEILRDDLLAGYGEHDIVAVVFGGYPSCFTRERFPTTAAWERWAWRWPELLAANPGIHVAWHGDDPWVPPISPVLELMNQVTRIQVIEGDGTRCDPPPYMAERTLTMDQALPMMNIEAAYAIGRDDDLGSITPGKLADLVVLDADPRTVDPTTLDQVGVQMTMVGGRVEFCDQVCP